MIDLRRLEVLRAVHQQGTVTAAASALHLTPSAVSHHLRELARELKLTLVEPQGRRIRLTPAALLVIEHGDGLLARWEEAEAALASYRDGDGGVLRLCGFPTAVAGLVVPAAVELRRSTPELSVTMTETETPVGFQFLLSHEADIAVVAPNDEAPPLADARFDQRPLLEEPLDLLVPHDHPLTRQEGVRLEDAAHEAWIVPRPGTCDQYQRIMVNCAAAGFTPDITQGAMDWTTISRLVAHGFGVSLMPRLAELPRESAAVRVPVTGGPVPTRRVLSCVRRGSDAHPLIRKGLTALADAVASRPDLART